MASEWSLFKSLRPVVPCAISIGFAYIFLTKRLRHPRAAWSLILAPAILACLLADDFSWDGSTNQIFIRFMIIFTCHHSFLFNIVSQDDLEAERQGRTNSGTPQNHRPAIDHKSVACSGEISVSQDYDGGSRGWLFAYKMLFNALCLGTRWEIAPRGVPSARRRESTATQSLEMSVAPQLVESPRLKSKLASPSKVEASQGAGDEQATKTILLTRRAFVVQRLLVLLCRYLAMCVYYDPDVQSYMPDSHGVTRADYSPTNPPFFTILLPCLVLGICGPNNPSQRYLAASRGAVFRLHWLLRRIVPDYLVLSAYHDIFAIIFVSCGLDEPGDWPPFFGSIAEAYTVRRFWASYWHRLVYRSFTAHAGYLAHRVLRLRRGAFSRYLINTLVFVFSGLMHYAVAWLSMPETCAAYGCGNSFWLWPLQVLGMAAESLVQAAFGYMEKRLVLNQGGTVLSNAVKKTIGYGWVICWIVWAAEVIDFPFVYRITSERI